MGTPTSTGKVKVEYSDPSSLFQLIASEFQTRLPLKNLNWTSSSRPTRSIDSLYVELIPDEKNVSAGSTKRTTPGNGPPDSPASPKPSGEFKRSESQATARTRRHQIPGLRRTPYLKIFLLRCDDTETYKATARRTVREWVRANPSNASNSQDNHDASEYLIVHVVLPDVQNGTTWPTKASASILEKLKSDFNGSTRGAPDRVVQIPATKHLQVQGMTINPVPAGPAREVFLQESDRVWDDLIAKMKLLILSSFDTRVKQYEEDIKEKGLQRNIPGWNFCTFFVLKEGLARGFESVGLIDDALMGYDELAIELLSATREDVTKQSRLFREHTQDLLIEAEAALQGRELSSSRPNQKRLGASFLTIDEKPYRELILASNISIFDFRCYVFARQVHLLLRLASVSGKALKANSSAVDLTTSRDPVILADICWRAKDFFADMARVIRQDLRTSFRAGSSASEAELKARYIVTENLISSWIYKGIIDILQRTRETSLPDAAVTEIVEVSSAKMPEADVVHAAVSTEEMEGADLAVSNSQSYDKVMIGDSFRCVDGLNMDSARTRALEAATLSPGTSSLAAERAELYLIARRAFASSGERQGWKTVWPTADSDMEKADLDEVSLDDDTSKKNENTESDESMKISNSSLAGVLDLSMQNALVNTSIFYKHWEELSLLAFILFEAAKIPKSVYLITADIAAVRVRLGDYAYAAPFLQDLGPKYAANQWHNLEMAVLDMYVFCLGKLDNLDQYVPAALQALGRMINARKVSPGPSMLSSLTDSMPFSGITLQRIVELSHALPKSVQASLDDFFTDVQLGDCLWHADETDDFGVFLNFTSEWTGVFRVDSAIVKLVGTSEGVIRREMAFSSDSHDCRHGNNTLRLVSKTMVPGRYALDSVLLECGKIRFHRSYRGTSFVDRNLDVVSHKTQQLLLWPSRRTCIVEASMYEVIHLGQPRAIIFTVRSNGNDISNAKLQLKSSTAGLRLQTSDAEMVSEEGEITNDKQPSIVPLGSIRANTAIRIRVPYRMEADLKEIHVRSELIYEVDGQSWVYGNVHRLMAQLPLGVNVQDVFKKDALFSKFAISTSSEIPIRVLRSKLSENESYSVSTPYLDDNGMIVFMKQPASLVYRIMRKNNTQAASQRKLSLEIEYQCLDEQVLDAAVQQMDKDLDDQRFRHLSVLLQTNLAALLPKYMREQDLETIGLLDELRLPDFSLQEWDDTVVAVPADDRVSLLAWLSDWYDKNHSIFIASNTTSMTRHIEIPVEIPTLPILHTVSIVLDKPASSRPYTLGEIIAGEVQISHTRSWSFEDVQAQPEELSFVYEIEASTDSWLIAGQRRGYFLAREDEVKSFPILLMPLRSGKVMMPVVEIRFARDGKEGEVNNASCETDYQGLGSAIEVAPGVTGVTSDVFMNTSGGLTGKVKVLGVERGLGIARIE